MELERLYRRLPVTLQHLAASAQGLRTERHRFNAEFRTLLDEAHARSRWSADRIADDRDRRAVAHARHAVTSTPHYEALAAERGFTASDIATAADVVRLFPILTKPEVLAGPERFVSRAVPQAAWHMEHTSGTTGAGLQFPTTKTGWRAQWATWWRYREWHGIRRDQWCGYFGGRSVVPLTLQKPPYWRYNRPGRQLLFSGYHMAPDKLPLYVGELRRRRPTWFHGYPSLIALLAAYVVDEGVDLGYQVEQITTGAENLTPHQRALMKRAFGVEPRQHYGMAEAVANASECEQGRLHVDEDFAFVELIHEPANDLHLVIGSNFTNPATPLIRYSCQDFAHVSQASCGCGRWGRLIEGMDGRKEDSLVLPDGSRVHTLNHIFKDIKTIQEAQIYQPQIGAVVFRVVPLSGFGAADEERLRREAAVRIGADTQITIETWERLPRTATGKLRLVVSDVA